MINLELLATELKRDEGVKKSAYRDSLGFLTIGVGRLIDSRRGGGLSEDEIDLLLSNDIQQTLLELESKDYYLALDTDGRRRALANMRFQLRHHLDGFETFLNLLREKKWPQAVADLRTTLWYRQTPLRAERVCKLLLEG